ncbi:NADAR family protein [Streptomonospora salina]|uniref:RibA/ribD-fused uncharacterized protein n=1 Tax=Streptomonospora salina TaxID=104205 RepID=A0A841E609_9ACTN|nr:NADAR family protein [Streptomonospora salina]MBB5998585.1 ribA/ribD-fused uncharacterized protein [Streptomonospora salina]
MKRAEPGSVAELRERAARGERVKYLFFWGHRPRRDGSPGAECLSQWWSGGFDVDGVHYPAAEHWMMAEKARLFGDAAAEQRILDAASPGAAKSAGREVRGFALMRARAELGPAP